MRHCKNTYVNTYIRVYVQTQRWPHVICTNARVTSHTHHKEIHCNKSQRTATHCNTPDTRTIASCDMYKCTATYCNTLQHVHDGHMSHYVPSMNAAVTPHTHRKATHYTQTITHATHCNMPDTHAIDSCPIMSQIYMHESPRTHIAKKHTATNYKTLQHTATHWTRTRWPHVPYTHALQHTATHCNTYTMASCPILSVI